MYCPQNAGSSFIYISRWEPEYSDKWEGFEESSGQDEKSSICEANFWFSSSSCTGKGFRPKCWCSCIDGMCADTDFCARRLPDPYRVYGKHCLMLYAGSLGSFGIVSRELCTLSFGSFAATRCISLHSTRRMFMLEICTLVLHSIATENLGSLVLLKMSWCGSVVLMFKLISDK